MTYHFHWLFNSWLVYMYVFTNPSTRQDVTQGQLEIAIKMKTIVRKPLMIMVTYNPSYKLFYSDAQDMLGSKDEHISNIISWTPAYWCSSDDQPAKTYMHLLHADSRCSQEVQPRVINEGNGCWERVKELCYQYTLIIIYIYRSMCV